MLILFFCWKVELVGSRFIVPIQFLFKDRNCVGEILRIHTFGVSPYQLCPNHLIYQCRNQIFLGCCKVYDRHNFYLQYHENCLIQFSADYICAILQSVYPPTRLVTALLFTLFKCTIHWHPDSLHIPKYRYIFVNFERSEAYHVIISQKPK